MQKRMGGHYEYEVEHDRLMRRYLAEHESDWRGLTGLRWLRARFKAEWRAWSYANANAKWRP